MMSGALKLDSIQALAHRDVKSLRSITCSEATIRWKVRRWDVGFFFPIRTEHHDPESVGTANGSVNVSVGIDSHTIDSELVTKIVQNFTLAE